MPIAWIDDDHEIIEPVIEPLIDEGYKILRFGGVLSALESIDIIAGCELVILDIILPTGSLEDQVGKYSGVYLLSKLRKGGVDAPVVVFSVVDPVKIREQLVPLGISAFVRKPALPSDLKESIDAALRNEAPPSTAPSASAQGRSL